MAEFYRAAARCDITVVRTSPVVLDERTIIEEELKARQWDTLAQRANREQELRGQLHNSQLDAVRQRENAERMRKFRIEERRNESLKKKDLDRKVKEQLETRRLQELENLRLTAVEEKLQSMEAERAAAREKAEQLAFEELQRRMRSAVPKSIEEQASELPDVKLTYTERVRIEKERLGRMEHHYNDQSIKAVYKDIDPPKDRPPTQLEIDIKRNRELHQRRLQKEMEDITKEDADDTRREKKKGKKERKRKKASHIEVLRALQVKDDEEAERRQQLWAEEQKKAAFRHPIDLIHKQVEATFLAEQEAEAVAEENLRAGLSQMDKLEEYMEVERQAWKEQVQLERELGMEMQQEAAHMDPLMA